MIINFKHKGLKQYFLKGDHKGLNPDNLLKIRRILFDLQTARQINDMNQPAYSLHKLKGELKDCWAVSVSGNYRIVFKFKNNDVFDVDYIDYH